MSTTEPRTPAAAPVPGPRLRHELLQRYGTRPVPRYTSYPPANHWKPLDRATDPATVFSSARRALSLYVHVPFCKSLCYYCGCNMLIEHRGTLVERYLTAIELELERVGGLLPQRFEVEQLHLGGGTPTHLTTRQLERLVTSIEARFSLGRGIEASIEVHPPVTSIEQLEALARLGFNRLSMGVQDFDHDVQVRINRLQPFEQTRDLVVAARRLGFESVNVDLMYGLPLQTPERFARTLDLIEELDPDRLALFGYAHLPKLKKHHRLLDTPDLPDATVRLALLESAIDRLERAGYALIGLDHFAKPHDPLLKARRDGSLRRNFMGYTTCRDTDVVAFGPSSISEINGTYLQNHHDVHAWCKALEDGQLAVTRGAFSTRDDEIRRSLIMQLFCQLAVDVGEFGRAHRIDFERYFAEELQLLEGLAADGLVRLSPGRIVLTAQGQLLLRNVAHVFDMYSRGMQKAHAPAV